jgi:hypothetical protein
MVFDGASGRLELVKILIQHTCRISRNHLVVDLVLFDRIVRECSYCSWSFLSMGGVPHFVQMIRQSV